MEEMNPFEALNTVNLVFPVIALVFAGIFAWFKEFKLMFGTLIVMVVVFNIQANLIFRWFGERTYYIDFMLCIALAILAFFLIKKALIGFSDRRIGKFFADDMVE